MGLIRNILYSIDKRLRLVKSIWLLRDCKQLGSNPDLRLPFTKHGLKYVSIGNSFAAGQRLKLRVIYDWGDQIFDNPHIIIGNNVSFQSDCHISAINSVIIDDNVLIASFVYISDHAHGDATYQMMTVPPLTRPLISKGGVHICKNVWLGEKVTVLPGVTIGEGSIIGANSVVTKDIPPYSLAVGSPAKVIKNFS